MGADAAVICHAVERHAWSSSETALRCSAALDSWDAMYSAGVVNRQYHHYSRDSSSIGCKLHLPFLKDVLRHAMHAGDIVLLTNDDTVVCSGIEKMAHHHALVYGAVSMHRIEIRSSAEIRQFGRLAQDGVCDHIGRDAFAFSSKWLEAKWNEIPDFLLGECLWDLCLAYMIRLDSGLSFTKDNAAMTFPGCEIPKGWVLHVEHQNRWSREDGPSKQHNGNCYRRWLESRKVTCPWLG